MLRLFNARIELLAMIVDRDKLNDRLLRQIKKRGANGCCKNVLDNAQPFLLTIGTRIIAIVSEISAVIIEVWVLCHQRFECCKRSDGPADKG